MIPDYRKLETEIKHNHQVTLADLKKTLHELIESHSRTRNMDDKESLADEIQLAYTDLERFHYSMETELFLAHQDSIVALKYSKKPHQNRYSFLAITDKVIYDENDQGPFRVTIPLTKQWVTQQFDPRFVRAVIDEANNEGFIHFNEPSRNLTKESAKLYEDNKHCLVDPAGNHELAKK